MSNLSQSEIDDLVASMMSGGEPPPASAAAAASAPRSPKRLLETFEPVPEDHDDDGLPPQGALPMLRLARNYRLYDFRRPEKLSKDQNRLLRAHFGLFLRRVGNYLANLSRSNVDVSLVEVDQTTYKDIFTSHGVPMVMCTWRMGPDQGMLKINLSHIFALVDRLMGGTGTGGIKPRPLTEFERNLCIEVFNQMLACYSEVRKCQGIEIENVETDERLLPRSLSGDEMMVRAIYDLRIGGHTGYLTLYLPLRNAVSVLGGPQQNRNKPRSEQLRPLPGVVSTLPLPVSVILGQTMLPAQTIAELKPGMVIPLDQEERKPLQVQVGKIPRLLGRPGVLGNRMAVTITGRWEAK